MLAAIFRTTKTWAPLLLRLGLGVIFIFHGGQKLFGLFGGGGLDGLAGFFGKIGIEPAYPMAVLVAATELLGGVALFVGVAVRPAAIAIAAIMVGAIVTVHGKNGFAITNSGYEYNVALIVMCASLLFSGGGRWSFDGYWARKLEERKLERAVRAELDREFGRRAK